MKVLVTGGCGFLGSNLSAHALARRDEVTVLDNLSRVGAEQNLDWLRTQGAFRFIQGDVRNPEGVAQAVLERTPDAVFHVAGQVAMTTSISNPRADFETNALGTLNVLEAVRAHSPRACLVFSSTNKVYGDLSAFTYEEGQTRYHCVEHPQGFDESVPLDLRSPYGCSKGCADQYVLDYERTFGLKTVVFRHSSIYGGRQFATFDQGWIGWFCSQALAIARGISSEPFTISGNGKQVRDALHADDAVELYFRAAERADAARGQVFNVGGTMANSLSLLELFDRLERRLDISMVYRRLPPRTSDQLVFVADITRATRTFGWRPEVTVERGLELMLDWLEQLS